MAEAEGRREDGIDFVSIVTPNVSHYEVAKAFLAQGILATRWTVPMNASALPPTMP